MNDAEQQAPTPGGPSSTAGVSPFAVGKAANALGWSFLNTVTAKFGTLAIGVVLARLLGPTQFGTYAVAYLALTAILSFNELGVSLSIVRWPSDPAAIAPTVTFISLTSSVVLAAAVFLAAPSFAAAMGDAGATNLVRAMSVCVILDGAVAVPAALLQRYFRQDRRMIADQTGTWLGAVVSLALVLLGAGTASLVAGRIVGAVAAGLLFVFFSPLPYRVHLKTTYLRPLLWFGIPLAGASMIVFAVGFVDQIMVGTILGSVALGYYVLAYNLATWPVTLLSQPVRSVAPAMFATMQDDLVAMSGRFHQLLRPLASLSLLSCVTISAAAEDIVRLVYGTPWVPAAAALRWLALTAALRILFELMYDYLVVLRRARSLLLIQLTWFAALVPALMVGVHRGGIAGVGFAQTLVAACLVFALYLSQMRGVGIPASAFYRSIRLPAITSVVVYGCVHVLQMMDLSLLLTLGLSAALALLAVAPLIYVMRDDLRVWTSWDRQPS